MKELKSKRIMYLIKKIRITREEWCEIIDNEKLKENNTYIGTPDEEIIIEALQHFLWEEEEELENIYDHKEKENDRTSETSLSNDEINN